MRTTVDEADPRVYERPTSRSEHAPQEPNGLQGILVGVLTGGLLWLALVWFIFSLL